MATAQEKAALGLDHDASEEEVIAAIEALQEEGPATSTAGLASLAEALQAQQPSGETQKRKIRHKVFSYRVLIDSPVDPTKKVYTEALARRGDTVDLLLDDIERGEKFGAFETKQSVKDDAVQELDAAEMSDGDLIRVIKDGGFNVNQTIALSKGDSTQAQRVLDAENSATGNDPRKGVIEGLTAVISRTQ